MYFKTSPRWKSKQRGTSVIKIRVLRKVFCGQFCFTRRRWQGGGIADLPSLRTPFAIRQMSREQNFWEKIASCVLVAYASLLASITLLPRWIAYLKITWDEEDLCSRYKQKKRFLHVMTAYKMGKTKFLRVASFKVIWFTCYWY